jgi:hypothetical protein
MLALETGISLHGGPVDHLGRGSFTGNSEIVERGLREASLRTVFCEGNLEGGSLTGDPEGYVEGSVDGHLSTWTSLGKLEGGSFTGDFERWMRQVSLSVGPLWGTWVGGPSIRNVENLLKECSGYGASLSRGALLGELITMYVDKYNINSYT